MAAGWVRREGAAADLPARGLTPAANDPSDPRFEHAARLAVGAERRALDAVGRLAGEVTRLAEALNRRLDAAEDRSSEELAAVRAELRELESLVARRLSQGEAAHAESVEALRAAMAEVVDRLTQRMDAVEDGAARSAQAVGLRVEALEQRVESGQAKLLETIDRRAGASEARVEQLVAAIRRDPPAPSPAPPAEPPRPTMPAAIAAILVLAAGAASVSLGAIGYQLSAPQPGAPAVRLRLPSLPLRPRLRPGRPTPAVAETPAPGPAAIPTPRAPRPTPPAATAVDYSALGQAAVGGDRAALARLQALAGDGAPGAQLVLGKLYEDGVAGLPRDLAQARLWTQRAAEGGDRSAMHNLALFLMNGEGGAVDAPAAARWFERAARAGVVDAQFNLGLLYEAGRGVPRNLALAYRWFNVAANAGDGMARARAIALEPRLTAAERSAAAKAAAAYSPGADEAQATAPVLPGAATVAETQRLLARGGYYIGETDGADSPAYRTALQAYARDHAGAAAP